MGAVALLWAACQAPPTAPAGSVDAGSGADTGDGAVLDTQGGDSSESHGDDSAADAHAQPALPLQPDWSIGELLTFGKDGRSGPLKVPLPLARRYLALRAEAVPVSPADEACLRFVDVQRSDGEVWVGADLPGAATATLGAGVCGDCPRPVSTQHGYALAVFADPSQGLASAGSVQLRVQLRHCATDLALPLGALGSKITQVRVQAASEAAVPAAAHGTLAVVLARGSGVTVAGTPAAMAAMAEGVVAAFAPAHVAPSFQPALDLSTATPLPAILDVSSPASPHLVALQAAVDAAWQAQPAALGALQDRRVAVVVLWPCLHYQGPKGGGHSLAGFASRIPGGGRVGAFASLVVVATGECGRGQPPASAELGGTVAHELGHLLGLYHSDGAHGLPDATGGADLMHSKHGRIGAAGAGFSTPQRAMLRAHPDVTYAPNTGL